jgi:hypothetical protein
LLPLEEEVEDLVEVEEVEDGESFDPPDDALSVDDEEDEAVSVPDFDPFAPARLSVR